MDSVLSQPGSLASSNQAKLTSLLIKIKFSIAAICMLLSSMAVVSAELKLPNHLRGSPAVTLFSLHNGIHSKGTSANINPPLHLSLASVHKLHRKHLSPGVKPAEPQNDGSSATFGHTSSTSTVLSSEDSMKRNMNSAPVSGTTSPLQSHSAMIPSSIWSQFPSVYCNGVCKPGMVSKAGVCICVYPIRIELLLNVSQVADQKFWDDFASQLGLQRTQLQMTDFQLGESELDITIDIVPDTGISFPAHYAHLLYSSLSKHRVHLDPKYGGNYKLGNFTWFEPDAPSPAPASAPSQPPSPSVSNYNSILIIVLCISIGNVVVIVVSVIVCCECQSDQGEMEGTYGNFAVGSLPRPISTSLRFIAYEELQEATKNFELASIIGKGGFGQVFQGVLSDGTPVAVKKLSGGRRQGDREFLVEVELLSRLHHRNLVTLVGYYSSEDSSQNLLCYELVPNGSLEAWLHGPRGQNQPLKWETRMQIALDAARGLAYLHEDSHPCVIHRDFKASNILLDNDFHAKVSDFGLAKEAPEGLNRYLSTAVMGTFGYVAPEYAMTGHLLVKSDVYSYGVVLLELLTGRKPVDMSQPSGGENIVTWARPVLRRKQRLEVLADPKLGGSYPREDFERACAIAETCVALDPSKRPSMGEVVQSLKLIQGGKDLEGSTVPNATVSSTRLRYDGTTYGPLLSGEYDSTSEPVPILSEDLSQGR